LILSFVDKKSFILSCVDDLKDNWLVLIQLNYSWCWF